MKLSISELAKICFGALSIAEENGQVNYRRFTKEKYLFLKERKEVFGKRALAPAGVRLDFFTDADELSFDYKIEFVVRKYAYIDVLCDGRLIAHEGKTLLPESEETGFSGRLFCKLPKGEHRICVFFPNNSLCVTSLPELSGATVIKPFSPSVLLYAMGDSITQGYDSEYPSLSYINKSALLLDAEVINHGIGGYVFCEDFISELPGRKPDIVTVAYGTNDWSKVSSLGELVNNCKVFLEKAVETFPDSKIFYISPIWRTELPENQKCGDFFIMTEALKKAASEVEGVFGINGLEMVTNSADRFWDGRVHPNSQGGEEYGIKLSVAVKECM